MQVIKLHKEFDKLQEKYGDKTLDAVYGAGCIKRPNIMFVFMNPTARNVATDKKWKGLKAQWLGTKQVWKLFFNLNFLSENIFKEIENKKPEDWDYDFSERVYQEIKKKKIYITNLSKATQKDARPLSNSVFNDYLDLLKKEILEVNPKIIISFGNQVSSILLNEDVRVSECRKKNFDLILDKKEYRVYLVYYPVGQGMRNIKKVTKDLRWIIKNN
ncbi:MAG: hypothetical protein KAV41_02690 [Candidatus Pacebacteria bacterium]|nr:hypothetical protein [Candidatus Paceibacterota bacterium]